jgi:hypothetical protein
MKASFASRSRAFVMSALNQRQHLIRSGQNASYNDSLRVRMEILRNKMAMITSDIGMARFFTREAGELSILMPKQYNALSERAKQMRMLLNEAHNILENSKISKEHNQ